MVVDQEYVEIHINKSKTNQYRDGNDILLSKLDLIACPVSALIKYVNLSISDMSGSMSLFWALFRTKMNKPGLRVQNKRLSYTRTREVLLTRLREVSPDVLNLVLHSLRASGASAAANSGVIKRCWKRHDMWRSDAANGYIKDSISNCLSVSQKLNEASFCAHCLG